MLDASQISDYQKDGFLLVPGYFSESEIERLEEDVTTLERKDWPGRIVEPSGEPNSIYITDDTATLFAFVTQPRLVACAQDLLDGPVYLHQAKLNSKVALRGSAVPWHRDFDFWSRLDGMVNPAALTAAVFLDAVDEHNAPLLAIPGSYVTDGSASPAHVTSDEDRSNDPANVGSWIGVVRSGESTVVGDLKYFPAPKDIVEPLRVLTGDSGTVAFFHCNLIHGSNCNMSPRGRRILFCSFNRTGNPLRAVPNPRPPYIANHNFTPLSSEGL